MIRQKNSRVDLANWSSSHGVILKRWKQVGSPSFGKVLGHYALQLTTGHVVCRVLDSNQYFWISGGRTLLSWKERSWPTFKTAPRIWENFRTIRSRLAGERNTDLPLGSSFDPMRRIPSGQCSETKTGSQRAIVKHSFESSGRYLRTLHNKLKFTLEN